MSPEGRFVEAVGKIFTKEQVIEKVGQAIQHDTYFRRSTTSCRSTKPAFAGASPFVPPDCDVPVHSLYRHHSHVMFSTGKSKQVKSGPRRRQEGGGTRGRRYRLGVNEVYMRAQAMSVAPIDDRRRRVARVSMAVEEGGAADGLLFDSA